MLSGMSLSKINLTGRRASSPGARNCSSKQKHSNFFKYSFALVPLYDVFCEVTGLNGKISQSEEGVSYESNTGRDLTIQFVSHNAEQMPWIFRPSEKIMKVKTGKYSNATFFVKNNTDKPMTARAVPSVAPSNANEYLKKLECFCFEEQFLAPGEEALLPVRFIFDSNIPESINNVALSYTCLLYTSPSPRD